MRTLAATLTLALIGGLGIVGCGDDDGTDNQNNQAEHLSDDLLQAEGRDPDFTCVDAPDPALVFMADTEVTGVVEDFEEGTLAEGVVVRLYDSHAALLSDTPFDESDPSDANGAYTVLAPANVQRVHYKMFDPTGAVYFDTIEMMDPIAGMPPGPPQTSGKDRKVVSWNTVETVQNTLGISRIEGRGIIAGTVYDCNRDHVRYAALRVYDGPATDPDRAQLSIWDGENRNSFYFNEGMPSRLREYTDPEGQFLTANIFAGDPVTVEIWGRIDPAWLPPGHADCTEGCLISTQEVPVIGDTIVITDMNPLYSSN